MKFLALLPILFAPAAYANDVLFLDMNASYHEIKAAEAAAKKAKRGFVAFPPMSDAQRKSLFDLNGQLDALSKRQGKECDTPEKGATPRCVALDKSATSTKQKLKQLKDEFRVSRDTIRKFLAEQDAAGKKFGSVVVSGHDGTGTISGHLGSIGDKAMAELFKESSSVKDSLRSLHLWGCYTVSPSSVLMNWKSQFPYMGLITGYDGRAPLSDKPAGWKYLAGVIEKEESLHAINDSKKLKAALFKLPYAAQVHSAIATCDAYANQKVDFVLSKYTEKCDDLAPKLKAREEEYTCYQRAQSPGCENPPEDTGAGPLRQFYQLVQEAEACREMSRDPVFRFRRAETMNLLFYRGVIANLVSNHGDVLEESDKMLAELGAPDSLRFANLDKVSRKEALAKLDQLLDFLRTKLPDFSTDPAKFEATPELAKLQALRNLQVRLTSLVSELGERCVPFNWHDAEAHETSTCMIQGDLGQAGVVAALEQADEVKNGTLSAMVEKMRKDQKKRPDGWEDSRNIDDMLFDARLARFSAHSEKDDVKKKLADAQVAWAERVVQLRDQKVPDPLADREAKALLYTHRVMKLEQSVREGSESLKALSSASNTGIIAGLMPILDAMEASIAMGEKLLVAAKLKEARFREELSPEQLAENDNKLKEAMAQLKPEMLKVERLRQELAVRMGTEQLDSTGNDPNREKLKEEVAKAERALAELNQDPDAAFERLVKEKLDGPPREGKGMMGF